MKILKLRKDPKVYSCNVYFVRGAWNALSDVNTLIDVGTNGFIIEELETLSTGVGKRRVEQVILTHEHFDHTGGLKAIIMHYKPNVYAFSKIDGVDFQLKDGDRLKIGDNDCEIIHTPGHSHDSVCIYCPKEKALFSGDTPLSIKTPGGTYTKEYVEILHKLIKLNIHTVYSGHDDPLTGNVSDVLKTTLNNVLKSRIVSY